MARTLLPATDLKLGVGLISDASGNLRANLVMGSTLADSGSIANTTVETAYDQTIVIPANTLVVGDIITMQAAGLYSTTGTPTLRSRFFLDADVFAGNTLTCGTGITDAGWRLEIPVIVRTIGATGTMMPFGWYQLGTATSLNLALAGAVERTVDTTQDLTISLKVTWSAASASNTTRMQFFCVGIIPANQ